MGDSTPIERPALAQVLATVTDRPVGHWIAELHSPAFRAGWQVVETARKLPPRVWWQVEVDFGTKRTTPRAEPLAITDPAEALETLCQRGVLPVSFVGNVSRAWWCSVCNGRGDGVWRDDVACSCAAGKDRRGCGGRHWPQPRTIADLLAWASLGAETIARAEHLARTTAERLRPWGVRPPVETATTPDGHTVPHERPWRVVWRVAAEVRTNIGGWPAGPQSVHDGEDRLAAVARWHKSRNARSRRDETTHETLATWYETHAELWPCEEDEARGVESPHAPVAALLRMGLAFDSIEGDALALVCPPLGGSNE